MPGEQNAAVAIPDHPVIVVANDSSAVLTVVRETVLESTGSGSTLSMMDQAISERIWVRWNREFTTSTTMAGIGGIAYLTHGASDAAISHRIWTAWNRDFTSSAVTTMWGAGGGAMGHPSVRVSDEQAQIELLERRREAEAKMRARYAEREKAKERAEIILQEHLTDQQKAELAANSYFTIRTIQPSGEERFYRIHRGRAQNIEQVDATGRRLRRLCIHPQIDCPDADTMLSQLLWLRAPSLEEEFRRVANHS